MESVFITGNWKSHKTAHETYDFFKEFADQIRPLDLPQSLSVVLCVPFTLLSVVYDQVASFKLPVQIGAQDISPFAEGAYTGEVNGKMIAEFAKYVIVGHSERRKYFGETDEMLFEKVKQAKESGLTVIYCVSDETQHIPQTADIIAYEPIWAIGTGKTDTPENACEVIAKIKATTSIRFVLYGGSINNENVKSFLSQESIDGVLAGGASLEVKIFTEILKQAAVYAR